MRIMRTINWRKWAGNSFFSFALIIPCHALAQTAQTTQAASDVVARGQHYKVMQAVRQTTNLVGEVTARTNRYTVAGNGLNFQDTNGNWIESHPVVQSYAGGIACTGASFSVILANNLNTSGAVDLEAADHQRIISNPLGLGFFDPDTGKSVQLAQIQDCSAMVSSNHILYPDAFTGSGLKASVEYVYDIGHFHQNITLLVAPNVQPSDYGMGSRTRLEMMSEILQSPTPVTTTHVLQSVTDPTQRAAMASPDVVDETLKFGSMTMGLGRAFPVGGMPTNQPGLTVPKQLLNIGGRNILIESVPWQAASAALSKPPQSASIGSPIHKPGLARELPEARMAQTGSNFTARLAQVTHTPAVKMAAVSSPASPHPGPLPIGWGEGARKAGQGLASGSPGFTLDYELVESCTDFDFYEEDGTYLVEGELTIDGTTHISDGVVIKYYSFGKLTIEGTIVGDSGLFIPQLVLTSINDDSVGEVIDGSNGHPEWGYTGAPALDLEYLTTNESFGELDFNYCYGGLWVDNSAGRTVAVGNANYINVPGLNAIGSVSLVQLTNVSVCNDSGFVSSDAFTGTNITLGAYSDCHDSNGNGIPDDWEYANFGALVSGTNDYDGDGTNNYHEWLNGTDPNKIFFAINVTNQYVTTNSVGLNLAVMGGVPASIAVLVDSTNTAGASWSSYTSSNLTVSLGTNDGQHDIRVGLRGLQTISQQTWEDTTVILDSTSPAITITSPTNGISFNSSRVNVSGHFSSASVSHIFVNGMVAFINGTNFEALNVPLNPGTNTLTASVLDLIGNTNSTSITVIATTNSDGSLNDPVQLQVGPVAGFYPLSVGFQATNNAPGTLVDVYYDFNGDDLADFTTNGLGSFTNVYATNGEFFPVVTIQTSSGRFSSAGGWDFGSLQSSSNWPQITVQAPPVQVFIINITDPVDVKWMASGNLYVLSGSTATITEYDSSTNSIRSLSGIGSSPSGLDVDGAGNVYVAMTGDNRVWKFNPTSNSFAADTSFGADGTGFIGSDRSSPAPFMNSEELVDPIEFDTPFDVAVSPDGSGISVSDSGNNQIQQFDTNGVFRGSFGEFGTNSGQFNTPKGIAYDSDGTLFIVDSGNSRIVLVQGTSVVETTGSNGTDLGQFDGPVNLGTGSRGVYVGDAGNNRIQTFSPSESHNLFNINPNAIRFAIATNLNSPAAVAAVENLTNELFYVADTGNDRVILYSVPVEDPTPVWTNMTSLAAAGNIPGAVACFSVASTDDYRQAFFLLGTTNSISLVNQIGTLAPVFIINNQAEYYFTNTIDGQNITFPVEFNKENGQWKITSF
jgi:hypothetical protein